ncbi:hypothetical protein [Desulfobacula toluolica]|nr:hypothetical protein [Desulfobacula toluolica]
MKIFIEVDVVIMVGIRLALLYAFICLVIFFDKNYNKTSLI